MWLYFNNRGQLVKALTHGPIPVAGTTNFSIFAVFEGIDSLTNSYEVSIKLRKPDLSGSEYPVLLMNSTSKVFELDTDYGETAEDVIPFRVADSPYHGFYFDFADFNDSQDVEILLDTPGLWEAIITIFGSDRSVFVQGIATFNVGNGIVNEDGSSINIDVLLDQIIAALATKIGVGQPTRVHDLDNLGVIKLGNDVDGEGTNVLIEANGVDQKIKIEGKVKIVGELLDYYTKVQSDARYETIVNSDGKIKNIGPFSTFPGMILGAQEYGISKAQYTGSGDYARPCIILKARQNAHVISNDIIRLYTNSGYPNDGPWVLDTSYTTEKWATTQLTAKQNISEKGQADGYASLDSGGKVPTSQLPSYVDDMKLIITNTIYEASNLIPPNTLYQECYAFAKDGVLTYLYKSISHLQPWVKYEAPEGASYIYISIENNRTYRYIQNQPLVEISSSLALGETSATAYRGDRGKTAYDHSQVTSGNPHNVTASETDFDNTIKNLLTATKVQGAIDEVSEKVADIEKTVGVSIIYSELKTLRDAGQLTPGQQYRITDYTCTTVQANTQSAGHQFDIIVTADDVNKLNENARAVQHEGDTYFANSKLEAWKLMYCLDNDTARFAWADDSANGKGVIYRMIDEFNNDCPYDFKNIQYLKVGEYVYTFGGASDNTLSGGSFNNKIDKYLFSSTSLNAITFGNNCYSNTFENGCYSNTFGTSCSNNTFGNECYSNTFGNSCSNNTFGTSCYSNTFGTSCSNNTFGTYCSNNTFGNSCYSNTFGTSCYSNTFDVDCSFNTFGTSCHSNTFDVDCYSNTFGTSCSNNTFGNECYSNTFGNSCSNNTFGTSCYSNTFENGCSNNTFGTYCSNNTFGNNCYSNTFENGCSFNTFVNYCSNNSFGNYCLRNTFGTYCSNNTFGNTCYSNTFGDDCSYLQISNNTATQKKCISVDNGTQGASSANKFNLYDSAILNKNYQVTFKKDADGRYVMTWLDDYEELEGKYKDNNLDTVWKALPHDIDGGTF